MNIINNNNGSYPCCSQQPLPEKKEDPLSLALARVRSGEPVSRSTYMTLAKYLGFFGVHYFAVRRWGSGFFQCLLTLIGAAAASGIVVAAALEPEYQEEIICVCFLFSFCLPVSVLAALFSCCYWFFHSDQEFNRTYYQDKTKGNEP